MKENITAITQQTGIWRGDQKLAQQAGVPTGFTALDDLLPGGWPRSAITEVLLGKEGIGELRLFMPALAQLSHAGRWVAWIAPPHIPYAAALATYGVNLSRVLLVHPKAGNDGLWAVEQALRSGTCGAVLAWPASGDQRQQRRLQLAAEAGQSVGILFRSEHTLSQASPVALRLRLSPAQEGLTVQVLKRRGGWASNAVVLSNSELELSYPLATH